jgi:hypothetical protein
MAFKSVDVRGPKATELGEPGVELLERSGLQPIESALCVDRRFDEAGVAKDAEMLGDSRLRHAELTLDLTDGLLGGGEEAENGAAVRLGDDLEGVFHGLNILIDVYTCQGIFEDIFEARLWIMLMPAIGLNRGSGDRLMMTGEWVRDFAQEWVRSWNAHDLEAILEHYADGVVLTSPVAARLLGDPSGNVRGKAALRAYFSKGLEAFPNLKFELKDVMWGLSTVVLYYANQVGRKTGEFMEIDGNGKVMRVVANYSE